jgi:hypothetical protein
VGTFCCAWFFEAWSLIYVFLCRDALRAKLIAEGVLDDRAYVVIAGPANTYGHYVTTREEYSVQRYEGASTIFGPGEFLLRASCRRLCFDGLCSQPRSRRISTSTASSFRFWQRMPLGCRRLMQLLRSRRVRRSRYR